LKKIIFTAILLADKQSFRMEKTMIEWFANSIAVFLVKENIITKEEDREVCQYGIEVILANAIGIIIILCISVLGGYLWQGIFFLSLYSTLRIYTGGYHANTYLKCNLYFAIAFLLTIKCFDFFHGANWNNMFWGLVIVGFLIVGALAPIENKNKSLSVQDKIRYRKVSVSIYIVIMLIMLIGDSINYHGSLFGVSMLYWYDFSLYIKIVLCSIVILMLFVVGGKHTSNTDNAEEGEANEKENFKSCSNNSNEISS